MTRRSLFAALAAAGCTTAPTETPDENETATMDLMSFEPRSTLDVAATEVRQAKYPAIDVHTHLFFGGGLNRDSTEQTPPQGSSAQQVEQIVGWMDELNVETMLNLTSGWGYEVEHIVSALPQKHEGRFRVCTEPAYTEIRRQDYAQWQADEIERAKQAGASGIKILKSLGLGLREDLTEGPLVAIDDERFDPMWAAAGDLGLPIFIHTSDPDAFFTPTDRFNERWEELGNHPDWSFHGEDFPSKQELLAQRNRVIERHPNTTFVGLHMGNHPENLAEVGEWLDRYPNFNIETGARLGELGRQPRTSRRFFERYQDRILFGTDAIPSPRGDNYPQQTLNREMYQCYFRFFETADEYFDYSPAPTPPQGRWKIYGIDLPDPILSKLYRDNAQRVLGA